MRLVQLIYCQSYNLKQSLKIQSLFCLLEFMELEKLQL